MLLLSLASEIGVSTIDILPSTSSVYMCRSIILCDQRIRHDLIKMLMSFMTMISLDLSAHGIKKANKYSLCVVNSICRRFLVDP